MQRQAGGASRGSSVEVREGPVGGSVEVREGLIDINIEVKALHGSRSKM